MHSLRILGFGLAGLALAGALGCCDTTGGGAARCPDPAVPVRGGGPPLLMNAQQAYAPPAAKPVKLQTNLCGEVSGDLVYNLGQGVISNSNAAILMGGVSRPAATRVPGGVDGRCNPVPDRYYETLKRNATAAPAAPAVVGTATAVSVPAAPQFPEFEPGTASARAWCAPAACPVLPGSAEVCLSGPNLSECFTLTEEELRSGPAVLVPNAGGALLPLPPEQPAAPVAKVEGTDKYNGIAGKADASDIPPLPVAGPRAAEAPTAFPSGSAAGTADDLATMPPIPMVTDIDDAVGAMDAVLSRDDRPASSLPSVELPPKLN